MPPVGCDRTGCFQHASWRPVVVLEPKARGAAQARATLEHNICNTHRQVLTVSDFVSEEHRAQLERGLREVCNVIAERPKLTLEWERLP